MTPAIHTLGLGKQYRLGEREPYGALRDVIARGFRAPLRLFGRGGSGSSRRVRDTIWALKDVSFDVAEGEIVGIVGRNGSGKSTLLKILSRVTEPTEGFAEIRGRVGSLLEVGTGFHPELTGRENVYVNGAILGMRRAEIARKFDEIVAFADVERFVDTPVKFYSSGMQMRLAFSVAAHLEPHILLVDEVLAVGDLAFQKKCLGKMDDVSRQGRTILFVSHQMNQIRRLCSRCLWLEGGRVADVGATADVVNRYEASFMEAVETAQPAAGSTGAAFLGWTLGESGSRVHRLSSFGPVEVRFRLRVDRPMPKAYHGIVLYNRDGQVMWGSAIDDLHLDVGIHELVYVLDGLPVRPGPYRWYVSLFENGVLVNNLNCIPEMSVETPPLGHRHDGYAGVLNLAHALHARRVSAVGTETDAPAEPPGERSRLTTRVQA